MSSLQERPVPHTAAPPSARGAPARGAIVRLPATSDQNPYQGLLYRELARYGWALSPQSELALSWLWRERHRIDLLHFHWRPDRLYGWPADFGEARPPRVFVRVRAWLRLGAFAGRLLGARLLGYRLVWTIHEVVPHEGTNERIDRLAAQALARACHLLIAHDAPTVARAREELGNAAGVIEVVPHGSYVGVYPPGRSRLEVRAELGIPSGSFVFLCFGRIRRWKDIELLLSAFGRLDLPDVSLVLAGRLWGEGLLEELRAAAEADGRIRLLPNLVAFERVAELFEASDAAVLPRSDGWTSGSLILALSQGLPPIAARLAAYEDLLAGDRAGWLFEPGDAESLRATMEAVAADPGGVQIRASAALAQAERLSWEDAGRRIAELLASL